jgi:hypothetical protein
MSPVRLVWGAAANVIEQTASAARHEDLIRAHHTVFVDRGSRLDDWSRTCYSLPLMSFRSQILASIIPGVAVAMLEGESLR